MIQTSSGEKTVGRKLQCENLPAVHVVMKNKNYTKLVELGSPSSLAYNVRSIVED